MPVPRLLFLLPALAAGALLPGLPSTLSMPSDRQIGFTQEKFARDTVRIVVGRRLTFVNNSHFLHVLAPGQDARLTEQRGMPGLGDAFNTHVSPSGDQYTTAAWNSTGTYHLTCTLHPEMTMTVVVVPK